MAASGLGTLISFLPQSICLVYTLAGHLQPLPRPLPRGMSQKCIISPTPLTVSGMVHADCCFACTR